MQNQFPIPPGFTHDPGSGLYYKATPGVNNETGQSGTTYTWFYPDTGQYNQSFEPAAPMVNQAYTQAANLKPASQAMMRQAGTQPAPNMAGAAGASPKSKTVMIVLTVIGFTLGLQYFYAGLTKKGFLFLFLYWPCFVIGWITFVLLIGWGFLAVSIFLVVTAIKDFIKLIKGEMLDGNGLPIVN